MQKKGLGFLLLAGLLIISALVFLPSVKDSAQAQAQTGFSVNGKIYGWLWSDNVGWIRMGTDDTNAVQIVDNDLQGHAWNDSIGWINFKPATTTSDTYPSAPNHGVQIEPTPISPSSVYHPVTGWARACSVFVNGCSGALKDNTARGGWDGWIKMVNSQYKTDSHIFSGYAWGDLSLGWINFHAGDPTIDCRNIPLPPGCNPNCTPNVNCTCDDPNPPTGCPPRCVPPETCDPNVITHTVICNSVPNPATVDETVEFTTTVTPNGVYDYLWTGEDGDNPSLTFGQLVSDDSLTTSYGAEDTYSVHVAVSEDGVSIGQADCNSSTNGLHVCEPGFLYNPATGICDPIAPACTFELSGVAITLSFMQDNSSTVETSEGVATISPSDGCTADTPLDLIITAISPNFFPEYVEMVCSNVIINPASTDWSPENCRGITDTTLIGVRAPSKFPRTDLINGTQLQVEIKNEDDNDNFFGLWMSFIGGTGT